MDQTARLIDLGVFLIVCQRDRIAGERVSNRGLFVVVVGGGDERRDGREERR